MSSKTKAAPVDAASVGQDEQDKRDNEEQDHTTRSSGNVRVKPEAEVRPPTGLVFQVDLTQENSELVSPNNFALDNQHFIDGIWFSEDKAGKNADQKKRKLVKCFTDQARMEIIKELNQGVAATEERICLFDEIEKFIKAVQDAKVDICHAKETFKNFQARLSRLRGTPFKVPRLQNCPATNSDHPMHRFPSKKKGREHAELIKHHIVSVNNALRVTLRLHGGTDCAGALGNLHKVITSKEAKTEAQKEIDEAQRFAEEANKAKQEAQQQAREAKEEAQKEIDEAQRFAEEANKAKQEAQQQAREAKEEAARAKASMRDARDIAANAKAETEQARKELASTQKDFVALQRQYDRVNKRKDALVEENKKLERIRKKLRSTLLQKSVSLANFPTQDESLETTLSGAQERQDPTANVVSPNPGSSGRPQQDISGGELPDPRRSRRVKVVTPPSSQEPSI